MKPYQGVLAFIGYLVLQSIVSARISMDYCEVISGIIALIAFGWLLHKKQMLPMSSRDLKGSRLLFCLGIGFGLALVSKTAIVLGVLSGAPIPERLLPDGFLWIPTVVVLIPIVEELLFRIPIVEELLFRGILFGSFCRSFSYKAAIVLSAILFAMVHYMVSWPSAFVIGVLLAWLYWRTDNLAVAMAIHCTINLGTFLSMPLYALLTTHRTIGVAVCLLVVLLGIWITDLSTKMFLQKHDADNV